MTRQCGLRIGRGGGSLSDSTQEVRIAVLCYVRNAGKTLMVHRTKRQCDMHAGKWNGLGGKLHFGETPEECAVREIAEESGLRITTPMLRGVVTFARNVDGRTWYVFIYEVHKFEGTLHECPEGELAWIEDEKLLKLQLWPGDHHLFQWLQQERFFSAKLVYDQHELTHWSVVFH